MGELIQINRDSNPPLIVCPHCKQQIQIDITPFAKDVSKILRDKCSKCGGEIVVGVLILANVSLDKLLVNIQTVVQALNKGNVLLQ